MTDRAPLKATFFTLARRDRAVLLPATISVVVIMALIVAAFLALSWGTLVELARMFGQSDTMGEEAGMYILGRFFGLFGMVLLFLFPLYLAGAAYEAACLRWMIRGEAPGLFGLTLDHDVFRVYGIYWCWFVTQMAISFAASIVTMPLVFMGMSDMTGVTSPGDIIQKQLTVQLPVMLLQYGAMIFVGVRLAPAAATSVACRRFEFFNAWKVTEGRFWSLFGSFATVWVILVAVQIVLGVAAAIAIFRPFKDGLDANPAAFFTPEILTMGGVFYGVMLAFGLVGVLMSFGINARAAFAALEEGKVGPPREG